MTNEKTSLDAVSNTGMAVATITADSAPDFEHGSIAFRYTLRGELQAWNVFESKRSKRGLEYRIMRGGLLFWELASNLLTGWESDFPGYEFVDWGDINPIPGMSEKSEPEDEYSGILETQEAELIELYSDLAEHTSDSEPLSQLPLFESAIAG